MKFALLLIALSILSGPYVTPSETVDTQEPGLPELYRIKQATLSPSYSCRSREESTKSYQQTALFLSDQSKEINAPDLLFNGACNSPDYLEANTAGDDLSLIADLGEISIEKLSGEHV